YRRRQRATTEAAGSPGLISDATPQETKSAIRLIGLFSFLTVQVEARSSRRTLVFPMWNGGPAMRPMCFLGWHVGLPGWVLRLPRRYIGLPRWDLCLPRWDVSLAGWNVRPLGRDVRLPRWDVGLAGWNIRLAGRDMRLAGWNIRLAGRDMRLAGWN